MGRGRPESAGKPAGQEEPEGAPAPAPQERRVAGPKAPPPTPEELPEVARLGDEERQELVNELLIRAGLAR